MTASWLNFTFNLADPIKRHMKLQINCCISLVSIQIILIHLLPSFILKVSKHYRLEKKSVLYFKEMLSQSWAVGAILTHTFDPSTQEGVGGGRISVRGQLSEQSEFQDSRSYTEKVSLAIEIVGSLA